MDYNTYIEIKKAPWLWKTKAQVPKVERELYQRLKDFTMITLTATSTPNFYEVLSSNLWDHYPLLVEETGLSCGCPGFTYHGHCYHALEAAQLVTFIPETTTVAVPVEGTDGHEVTCSCCGSWMMVWAFEKHLHGNFCEMYLQAKKGAAPAVPTPLVLTPAAYVQPLAA